jgi:MFS family permease
MSDMGDYVDNKTKMGWLTSILELGAWFGAITSGFVAESLSRKYAILVNVSIFIIGVVVQATAIVGVGHNSILGGRFVTGMGVGALSTIVPMASSNSGHIFLGADCSCEVQRRDRSA